MKVWEALLRIKDGEIADKYFGICFSIEGILTDSSVWCENQYECYRAWSEFSGSSEYPVPHKELEPSSAYLRTGPGNMWNPDHPYGAARLRLLSHCVDWFKERDL